MFSVWHTRGGTELDRRIRRHITVVAAPHEVVRFVRFFDSPWLVVTILTVGFLLWRAGRAADGARLVASVILSLLVTEAVLKPFVLSKYGRTPVFPSGTVTAASATALSAWWLIGPVIGKRLGRLVLAGALAGLVLVEMVGVVVIGMHFPSDALGGVCVGVVVTVAVHDMDAAIRRRRAG